MSSSSAMISTIGARFSFTPSIETLKQRNVALSFASAPHRRRRAGLLVKAEVGINQEIRKNEDKVVDSVVVSELSKPLTAYCRCWKSGTFPLCDGSHVKHNKATGDNVGPLLVKK
ncbi:CDGSH iron-sulfur domain-containing protein NEET [Phalaenopsis equestris]|uniref:CDGSH iron-sulfur domain-containing protein NEET n=1 Tax=Phalaenopsis equestris TaxID=78828 RepID=UPI0009E2B1C2|nr:CDGSH iron-sulfur domain-containing protein NEET [Phalaenopsis equestris]